MNHAITGLSPQTDELMLKEIMGCREMAEIAAYSLLGEAAANAKGSSARISFQWGGSVFALILLVLNYSGRRSSSQKTLLVLFLFTSFPQVLFEFVRGQFGYWVAFLAISANLFFPETFSVSPFLLLVITPDWIADVLRDTVGGTILSLLTVVLLLIMEFREDGGTGNCSCNFCRLFLFLCIAFLLFFTVEYLCSATW